MESKSRTSWNCRCSTQQSEFKCPGNLYCHQHCARMQTSKWDLSGADLDDLIKVAETIGLPKYRGSHAGAPKLLAILRPTGW